jgi:hypothetical protein
MVGWLLLLTLQLSLMIGGWSSMVMACGSWRQAATWESMRDLPRFQVAMAQFLLFGLGGAFILGVSIVLNHRHPL